MTTVASRKRRGRETELIVAGYLAAHGWPFAEATGSGTPGRDVTGTPGLAFEIKARRGFDVMAAMRQAIRNAGCDIPLIIMRPDGAGPATVAAWPLIVPLGSGIDLIRQAGFGGPPLREEVT